MRSFRPKKKKKIKAASSVGRALAVHAPRGMLPSGHAAFRACSGLAEEVVSPVRKTVLTAA